MAQRNEYYLDMAKMSKLPSPANASEVHMRHAYQADLEALSELMIEAYRGTIDYDGETIKEAKSEIQAYMDGQRGGQALLKASKLCFEEDSLVAACLLSEWDDRQQPMITYVMTHGDRKKRGYAKQVLWAALQELLQQGYREVRAVITEGNMPSEQLFTSFGFKKVSDI